MKKFLMKVSVFLAYMVLFSVIFSYIIDPFNVFHVESIRTNGLEPNKHYIKMEYILRNPDKFNSFIFGSSRVGAIHSENIREEKCYNMTYSAGTPAAHLENIKAFLEHNIHPAKIYMGVDSLSYMTDYAKQRLDAMRSPWSYLHNNVIHFFRVYCKPNMGKDSLKTTIRAMRAKNMTVVKPEAFYNYGWSISYSRDIKFDWNNPRKATPSYGDIIDIPSTLRVIKEIVAICRENNIELVIFTNPMHYITYTASVDSKSYFDFLAGLAEISDFWNFSSLNDITLSNDCYHETSHYKAEIGDMIIDAICYGKIDPKLQAQGFGFKVTRENVKDFMNLLKHQAESYTHKNTPAQ